MARPVYFCGPPVAQHTILGHIVFEARRADPVMRFVNGGVRIQDRVVHNPINEIIDHGGDRVDPAETVIEHGLAGHRAHFSAPLKSC
jgi:hypothetical protein